MSGKLNALMRVKRERPSCSRCSPAAWSPTSRSDCDSASRTSISSSIHRTSRKLEKSRRSSAAIDDDLDAAASLLPRRRSADSSVAAYIPIIYGCNFLCSYCIVPYRRGKERSRPHRRDRRRGGAPRDRRACARSRCLVRRSMPTATICRRHPAWPISLRAVDAVPGLDRLRFLTSHPKYMSDASSTPWPSCPPSAST